MHGEGWIGLLRAPEVTGKQPTPAPGPASAQPAVNGQNGAILGCGGETISTSFPAVLQGERCLLRH